MLNAPDASSIRPYLLRAFHEWCMGCGYTPYVMVGVDEAVQVPMEYVRNGEIVLNVSYDATVGLLMGNDFIEFKARFGGVPRQIIIPVGRIMAIYARENGQGMTFAVTESSGVAPSSRAKLRPVLNKVENLSVDEKVSDDEPTNPKPPSGRPTLTRVK